MFERFMRRLSTLGLVTALSLGGHFPPLMGKPSLEDRLSRRMPNSSQDKYALLISGMDEKIFSESLVHIERILNNLGFLEEDIFVLDEDGQGKYVDGKASRKNIESVFGYLENFVDQYDTLVIHITDHGKRDGFTYDNSKKFFVTSVELPGQDITAVDIELFLQGINPYFGLVSTDICYGGGLAQQLGHDRFIAVSASQENQLAYYNEDGEIFGKIFYSSFDENKGDANGDDIVSIQEAFDYANEHYFAIEEFHIHPMIVSEIDPADYTIQ